MKELWSKISWFVATVLGSSAFGIAFGVFLDPNGLNAGGISGLAQVIVEVTGIGTVGVLTILINLPLFVIGGLKIGKRFFFGSLLGLGLSSALMDVLATYPMPQINPLLAAIYGGVITGVGLGFVFVAGTSTGGSDIVVRLVKLKARNVPIGQIAMAFDVIVVTLTGIVYKNFENALYTGIAVFLTSKLIDAVVYGFDYSKVAWVMTREYEAVAKAVGDRLGRGATYLYSQGTYSLQDSKVVLVALKRQQVSELKELVMEIDPNAFVILQEAHQVLGDGFAKHSKDSL